jgi:diguanylate cyclase (GGDEF)-like protein
MVERIRRALDAEPAKTRGGATLPCTASFGIATFVPGEREDWESLFSRADAALYRAKHEGRNRVVHG